MVTITDIAKALGITPSTVSRALSGSTRVREETRRAVHEKAREMGYEPNVVASNLRKGQSKIVGIIVPRIHREFFSNVIGGAESVLGEAGYNCLICQTLEDPEAEEKALRTLKNYRVAAVLISHAINSTNPEIIREVMGETPIIQFDRVFEELPGAKIEGANFDGAYKATRHLIDSGYKKIGTIAGYLTSRAYRERLAGYRQALEDAGKTYDERIVYTNAIVRETGSEACRKAIEAGCDALYSAGAFSALGAIDVLKEKGISIPDEFGIVGTANEGFTSLMTPSMSTLNQHPFEMGQAAARAFLDGREDTQVIPMELNIRESSNRYNKWLK